MGFRTYGLGFRAEDGGLARRLPGFPASWYRRGFRDCDYTGLERLYRGSGKRKWALVFRCI